MCKLEKTISTVQAKNEIKLTYRNIVQKYSDSSKEEIKLFQK